MNPKALPLSLGTRLPHSPAEVYLLKNRFLFWAVLAASLSIGFGLYAQVPNSPVPSQQTEEQPKTLSDCLTKGQVEHGYVISDSKSGEKVNFSASEKIELYLNQTVQIDGQETMRDGEKIFTPQTVKKVSPSCEGTPGQ